ncbi:sensor domain-containing protein [Promicromonospora thailandica]|uniref:sensor histidine kinase n=1 Tax=Promicromonospora thailandica TaxID=765201 RepID=UPI0020A45DCC|nr:sensor domain-containing protein [Promicromonospora thailandica]
MTSPPDVWAALRGRPWRFLCSSWPWRALAYLAGTVPVALVVAVALFVTVGVGVLTAVLVVGLLVLSAIPIVSSVVAGVERRRMQLLLGRRAPSDGVPWRTRLRALRTMPVAWREVGYTVLLAVVLWVVDAVALGLVAAVPGVLLAAPVLVLLDGPVSMGPWQVDTPAEAWLVVGPGLLLLAAGLYGATLLAAAQASLARILLDPQQARLAEAVAELRRSRVSLVDAFETERRRIERDLHDGAQQRLVALTMTLGRAELEIGPGAGLDLVREAHGQAEAALLELRSTVRGIHPRVLVDHGLDAAVHEIADVSEVPVTVDLRLPGRLPGPVEAAAYFVVSEALTNVVRHATARSVRVHGRIAEDRLVLTVVDDGVGGAVVRAGGGLAGLAVRLEALDGELSVTSPAGGPTEVRATCPVS